MQLFEGTVKFAAEVIDYRFGVFFIDYLFLSAVSIPQILFCLLLFQRKLEFQAGMFLR